MGFRTTTELVKETLQGDYDRKRCPKLDPYIRTANILVDRVSKWAENNSITVPGSELQLVETWLAAHFYAQADKPYTSRSEGGASGSFQGQTGMYLESTLYGQTAVTIDSTGYLRKVSQGLEGGQAKARGFWLGKAPTERIPEWERD